MLSSTISSNYQAKQATVYDINGKSLMISISINGAVYKVHIEESSSGSPEIIPPKQVGYICRHCLTIFADHFKARAHISKMHFGPVKFPLCGEEKVNILCMKCHQEN